MDVKFRQDAVSVSVTKSQDGNELFVSLVNIDAEYEHTIKVDYTSAENWELIKAIRLYSKDVRDQNTFDEPYKVAPKSITAEVLKDSMINVREHSVATLVYRKTN